MEDMKTVIDEIAKASGISELAQVTTFSGDLEGVGEVVVSIRDRGEGHRYRYAVSAHTVNEPIKTAAGNPEAELDTAIAVVHWGDLKR